MLTSKSGNGRGNTPNLVHVSTGQGEGGKVKRSFFQLKDGVRTDFIMTAKLNESESWVSFVEAYLIHRS